MRDRQLLITRMPQRAVSLLQIHSQSGTIDSLDTQLLGSGRATCTAGPRAYRMGPNDWLLVDHRLEHVRRHLIASLGRVLARLTDVSATFASLRVEGLAVRNVLATENVGALASAQPGEYARVRLGCIDVVGQCLAEDAFELHVDHVLADSLVAWLVARYEACGPQLNQAAR